MNLQERIAAYTAIVAEGERLVAEYPEDNVLRWSVNSDRAELERLKALLDVEK